MRSAVEIARQVRGGLACALDVVEDALASIRALDPRVRAFVQVDEEGARRAARQVDDRVHAGVEPGPLGGVPVAVKANIAVRGLSTSCCSRILEGWSPPSDATCVERLREAGAVILGTTNMDEFGMGSSTENSIRPATRNPLDMDRVPGGSSGGSAAAVASGMAPVALGSDTGGSVRQPAAFCGVVGVRPTYGRVSRRGLVAFASSLDQIGPIAGSVEDAFATLAAVAGHDPQDSTSIDAPCIVLPPREDALEAARKMRLGIAREALEGGIDPEIRDRILAAAGRAARLGAHVEEVSLPGMEAALAAYHVIAPGECSSNLARFDGVRFGLRCEDASLEGMYSGTRGAGFGPEVKRRIIVGTFVLSRGYRDAYYVKAQKVRSLVIESYRRALARVDAILTPTTPATAFRLGDRVEDPLSMYASDLLTVGASLAGLPAASVPCGTGAGGLPVGIQVTGPALGEDIVYRASLLMEEAAGTPS